ncbi:MAG: AI-2E family transporter, partial [Acetobacteraceae bacterium]|nr:AI-2E family transporter [Acetobacteraceae bacterium]
MPIPPASPRRGVAAAATPGGGLALLQGALLIIAVLYFGADLLIPLALSVLLAFVLAPVTRALRRLGLPRAASVLLAVALAL